jgi:valyl-tRNA synthetase
MQKHYDPKEAEKRIQTLWEKEKVYKFKKNEKTYAIDTPPPTLSGNMHIGHAFSYSQQDFIVRFQRMKLGSVFYPFGTDDNGLPTERLVEKLKHVRSKDMSRTEFIDLCKKTLKEITNDFINQWKKLGISCDYDNYYSTINDNSRKISQENFIELYNKKQAYKKDFPTIWCPDCQTSIAQAELEDKDFSSFFSTLKFKCDNQDLLIATTRPELLGACVAIFVHPDDKRYFKLVGKKAKVPLFNFEVPILKDKSADPEKGTGVLMVCSYGDKFDVDAIIRHKLKPKVIFNKDGTLNIKEYNGLKIKEARKKILEDLEEKNLIQEQKQINHVVNVHDKCGNEIEFIPTEQWFIKILDKKEKWLSQGKKINWYPKFMYKRYENWVKGLEWDWNISRDRHFGIPIPVWYCEKCKETIVADKKELPVDPTNTKKKCSCGETAKPETKVLDTWATSSLSPQIAGSLSKIKVPYSLRPQAHDIIRTWAFYTVIRSYLHEGKLPWKDIVISGNVSLKGEKMSKSKGNVIDPKDMIEQYSTDALRFWAASSKLGEDLPFQEKELVSGQKTITKLWNASKFVNMHLEKYKLKKVKLHAFDSWQLSRLNRLVKICTEAFDNYEYSKVKSETENFFWHTFCDNYLEIIKDRVYNGTKEEKASAQFTLYTSLLTILKLFAPIMPHITEELYQAYFKKQEKEISIHLTEWPKYITEFKDKKLEKEGDELLTIISEVRQFKNKNQKPMKEEVILTIPSKFKKSKFLQDLTSVTSTKEMKFGKETKVEF